LQELQEFVGQYLQLPSPVNNKVEIGFSTKNTVAMNQTNAKFYWHIQAGKMPIFVTSLLEKTFYTSHIF
jgi:ethanolamine utilization protein EutP (predicted NTPase)